MFKFGAYGWKASKPDNRDWQFKPKHRRLLVSQPTAHDTRTLGYYPGIYNQGQLSSCGPNSKSRILAFNLAKAGKKGFPIPSRLFIYWVTRALMGTLDQDSGVDNRTMMQALAKWGWCGEDLSPYSDDSKTFLTKPTSKEFGVAWHEHTFNYFSVAQDLSTMKACLLGNEPILVGFTVYASFESDAVSKSGLVPLPGANEEVLGGHDIVIVGYDDTIEYETGKGCFIGANSWGAQWGLQGYFHVPYEYFVNPNLAGDFWATRSVP